MSKSNSLFELLFGFMIFIGAVFVSAIIGTAIGAFTGWIVSLTPLGSAVIKIWYSLTHIKCELWELGAFLGFIAGFFKGVVTVKESF